MDIIKSIEHEQLKNKVPMLKVGDTVKVHVRVKEGNRERIQVFEGIIIKKQGGGVNETFTVRRISYGVGVEKTFLLHSPTVEKVEVIRVGRARRAKLYYLRDRVGKAAKTKEQVGARIETNMVTVKEDVLEVPETPAEEVAEAEAAIVEETPVAEEVKEEAKVEEAPIAEEAPVEEAKAEEPAPAVEEKTEEPAPVEEVTAEEPATEETPAEDGKDE